MFAVNQASIHAPEMSLGCREVVILSRKGTLDGCPPVLPQGLQPSMPSFARVKLRYVFHTVSTQALVVCAHMTECIRC